MATNQPAAISNLVHQTTGVSVKISDPNDPVEKEYRKLMAEDDAAQAEVDEWIKQNQEFAAKGAGMPTRELNEKIFKRFAPIKKSYDDFISRHPKHVEVRIAYASFLEDIHDEDGAQQQLETALEL